ncbi:MAG: RHS repeat-associated core domain-containing protein [bacterium]|nr:RHS repeat-associated core domain-containing protein [bacterium]
MQAASSLGASCVYNPYGETIVQQTSFYHDADHDGDIDAAAEADLEACADDRPTDPVCVFVHDRNGDQTVDAVDLGLFAGFSGFDSNGTTPPADFERTHGPWFDANGDGELDVFDFTGYQQCLSATDAVCLYLYDADNDDDVDLTDFVEFQNHWGEAGIVHTLFPLPGSSGGPTAGSKYGNPFMWTGQRYDAPVGLYHFVYRSYSPTLGRWLQRDPLGYVDGASFYEFVRSAATSAIDPLGLYSGIVRKISEAVGGVCSVGPGPARDAGPWGDSYERAVEHSNKYQGKGPAGDKKKGSKNAARHAMWQACLTYKHGEKVAKKIADTHEAGNPEDDADTQADEHNNQVGRAIGRRAREECVPIDDIGDMVDEAMEDGSLIEDRNNDPRLKNPKKGGGNNSRSDSACSPCDSSPESSESDSPSDKPSS